MLDAELLQGARVWTTRTSQFNLDPFLMLIDQDCGLDGGGGYVFVLRKGSTIAPPYAYVSACSCIGTAKYSWPQTRKTEYVRYTLDRAR